MEEAIFLVLQKMVEYLFNPARAIDMAMKLLGMVFNGVGYILTHFSSDNAQANAIGNTVLNLGSFLSSGAVQNGYKAVLYLLSPLVSPSVVQICIVAIWWGFLVTSVISIFMYLKDQLPGLHGGTT